MMGHRFECVILSAMIGTWSIGLGATQAGESSKDPAASDTPAAALSNQAAHDPLAGPAVIEAPVQPRQAASLIERDFEGAVRKLDVRPEIAALELIGLTEAERTRADRVIADRAALMEKLVRQNIGLLTRAEAMRSSDNPVARLEFLGELREAFAPALEEGSLDQQLIKVLPEAKAAHMHALVEEYWQALATAEADGEGRIARFGGKVKVQLEALGQEIRQTFERYAAEGNERLDTFIRELDLTPEQEGKVRTIAIDFAQKNFDGGSRREKFALFMEISRELTPEQKKKLMQLVRDRR